MRKSFLLPAVLTLFLLVPASITWAQTISSQKGLTTAVFQTPNGTIKVYLPDDIRAGDMISGTVTAAPEGNNERQLQRNLAELARFRVLVNGQLITLNPQGNQTLFTTSAQANPGCNLGIAAAGSAVPVQQLTIPPVPPALQKKPPAQCIIPGHVLEGSPMTVPGPFDGNAANTQCSIGNQPATILAESPRSCTVQFPANANGMQQTQISESGQAPCTKNVSAVQMNVTAGKLNLRSGEKTFIKVDISGLQDLPDTALLSLINMSTGVVNLLPSNTILIPLLPAEVASGNFSRQFDVQSTRTGNFTVNVNLDLPDVWLSPGPDDTGNENPDNKKGEKTEGQEEATGETVESGHTQEKQPGSHCECDGSCSVLLVAETDQSFTYQGIVRAACKGVSGTGDTRVVCEVGKIVYKWHMSDKSKEVVEFDGPTDQQTVKLKKKAPGNFSLNLTVTITCSDGTECERNCNAEGTIPPPFPQLAKCIFSWEEDKVPVMDGRLKPAFVKKYKIRRDEFIPLGAEGSDDDKLTWNCVPLDPCKISGGSKQVPLNGRVRFEWHILKGGGSFSQLGCFPDEALVATGDYVIFKPPVVPLPVKAMDTTFTTLIKLFIIDDNPTQIADETVIREITITTKRSRTDRSAKALADKKWAEGNNILEDLYEMEVKSDIKYTATTPVTPTSPTAVCKPLGPNWDKLPAMDKTEILLPATPGKEIILLGQWVALQAKDVRDKDMAKKIFCDSPPNCPPSPPVSKPYEDNVRFNWSLVAVPNSKATGVFGSFANGANSDAGSWVIYKAPDVWPAKIKGDYFEVRIKMYASNPVDGLRKDDPTKETTLDIKIYRPGVKLSNVKEDWLPEEKNSTAFTSTLAYKKDGKWEEAPPHACRIHFFELMNVSRFKGVCMNDPLPEKADSCRDLYLEGNKKFEAYVDTITEKCTEDSLFLQGRSLEPAHHFTVEVQSKDYAAIGYLRSFANLNKGGADSIKGEVPVYEPVPLPDYFTRSKYSDNRVILPYDANEDSLPDKGWLISKTIRLIYSGSARDDLEDKPKGNEIRGDGFTAFEEYRGFKITAVAMKAGGKPGDREMVMVPEEASPQQRCSPVDKDLFVRNKHGLSLASFRKATGLTVHEISPYQYVNDEDRRMNFNSIPEMNLGVQKGLYLYNGGTHSALLGNAYNNIASCGRERPAPPNWEDSIVIYCSSIDACVTRINEEVDKKNETRVKEKKPEFPHLSPGAKTEQVIAHELGHGINLCHHGEGDHKEEGSYNKPNGLRSGNIDCIMRYDNAGEIRTTGEPEIPGTSLCTSAAGTGYNRDPVKFGAANAADGRGNCAAQMHLNGTDGLPGVCLRGYRDKSGWKEYDESVRKKRMEEERKRREEAKKSK